MTAQQVEERFENRYVIMLAQVYQLLRSSSHKASIDHSCQRFGVSIGEKKKSSIAMVALVLTFIRFDNCRRFHGRCNTR